MGISPNLMTKASKLYDNAFRSRRAVAASAGPRAMRAGAACWAGAGRIAHGMSEEALKALIGPDPENLTMSMPCRKIFAAGQRKMQVAGPLPCRESDVAHDGFRAGPAAQ